jgi:RNA-binding motif X-linked protein 2
LTEGDIITVFSQFGDIVDINMARDGDSGKSLGFCFLAFENQLSTVLAIDNMIGYPLLGRPLRVDHVQDYKPPVRYHPTQVDQDGYKIRIPYEPTGAEGKGVGVYNVTDSQKKLNAIQAGMHNMLGPVTRQMDDVKAEAIKDEPSFETPRESRPISPR